MLTIKLIMQGKLDISRNWLSCETMMFVLCIAVQPNNSIVVVRCRTIFSEWQVQLQLVF